MKMKVSKNKSASNFAIVFYSVQSKIHIVDKCDVHCKLWDDMYELLGSLHGLHTSPWVPFTTVLCSHAHISAPLLILIESHSTRTKQMNDCA